MELTLTLFGIAVIGLFILNVVNVYMWKEQMEINSEQSQLNRIQSELNQLQLAIHRLREKAAGRWVDPLDKDEEVSQ